jgi:hypothetical protein
LGLHTWLQGIKKVQPISYFASLISVMRLPPFFESGISMLLYLILLSILVLGLWQFLKSRYILKEREAMRFRSVVPLGWAGAAVGFIGLFKRYSDAFEMIEEAGDISPSIVAGALHSGFSYPMLGFLCLAISYVFKFVNQYELTFLKLDPASARRYGRQGLIRMIKGLSGWVKQQE